MSGMPLVAVLALVFVALFVIVLLATGSLRAQDQRQELADRIERYGPRHGAPAPEEDGKTARAAVGWMAQLLRSSNTEHGLAERLELAGIARKPAEWALLGVCGRAPAHRQLAAVGHVAAAGPGRGRAGGQPADRQ